VPEQLVGLVHEIFCSTLLPIRSVNVISHIEHNLRRSENTQRPRHKPVRYIGGIQHIVSFMDPRIHPSSLGGSKFSRMPCSSTTQNSCPRALRMKLSGHTVWWVKLARQTCTLLSAPLQATSVPSCDTATDKIRSDMCRGCVYCLPLSESNILMLASSEADTIL